MVIKPGIFCFLHRWKVHLSPSLSPPLMPENIFWKAGKAGREVIEYQILHLFGFWIWTLIVVLHNHRCQCIKTRDVSWQKCETGEIEPWMAPFMDTYPWLTEWLLGTNISRVLWIGFTSCQALDMDYLLYIWQETEVCPPSPMFTDQGNETQKGGVIHVQDQAGHH